MSLIFDHVRPRTVKKTCANVCTDVWQGHVLCKGEEANRLEIEIYLKKIIERTIVVGAERKKLSSMRLGIRCRVSTAEGWVRK